MSNGILIKYICYRYGLERAQKFVSNNIIFLNNAFMSTKNWVSHLFSKVTKEESFLYLSLKLPLAEYFSIEIFFRFGKG